MRVVPCYPPLIDEIDAAFQVRGKPILYAWGDKIFNPMQVSVPPELVAHEKVHGDRQSNREAFILSWWRRYIADPSFRLEEEIPAHVAEFRKLIELNAAQWKSIRACRRAMAAHVARKLSAPLYGNLIGFEKARRLILENNAGRAEGKKLF